MRIMVFTDVHWATFSSIIRTRGEKYSTRLENLINSVNWVESLSVLEKCDAVVCCGDFFDKSELTAEELTALKEINWSGLSHIWVVGNHEISRGNLEFSTQHLFSLCPNSTIMDEPQSAILGEEQETELCFLPYINSFTDKSDIASFFPDIKKGIKRRIVFSHNDIKGIQYGGFLSKEGFELNSICEFCDLFINGHLHNGESLADGVINLGNLSGQNFSEDAFKYQHCCCIVDTESLYIDYYENPYAFNFYKYTINSIDSLKKFLSNTKNNSVVTFRCPENIREEAYNLIVGCTNIIEHRIIVDVNNSLNESFTPDISELVQNDHIQAFNDYILSNLGNSDIIKTELIEVCK